MKKSTTPVSKKDEALNHAIIALLVIFLFIVGLLAFRENRRSSEIEIISPDDGIANDVKY